VPGAQLLHDDALELAPYLPAGQVEHELAPAFENVPAGHAAQLAELVEPVVAVYFPTAQLVQTPPEEALYLPEAHAVQDVDPDEEDLPAAQLVHETKPVAE